MSKRKKWRIQMFPSLRYESVPSMKQAYERTESYRAQAIEGMTRVRQVTIQVDVGDGFGWRRFEVIDLPQRPQESA
jgi:hypothetical protein